ncbi:MAG: ribbon-helix-helix protein, CopG family [Candidatus Margulisbacteria bacterium]|nr:ribbon-helix-helix protein, CopG family [Candidatus Margulisiibacteriota bacterium]
MGKRVTVNTTLDEDLIKKVKILAIEEGKRMNDLIEEALQELISRKCK